METDMQNITDAERRVIINALYTAADKYRDCAKEIAQSGMNPDATARLVATFKKQSDDCAELLEKIED